MFLILTCAALVLAFVLVLVPDAVENHRACVLLEKDSHHEYIFNIQATGGAKSPFAGNGLSRTAMLFKITTIAGHKLTVPEMNKFKEVNPRSLERVYNEVVRVGDAGNALFALRLILKN